MRRVRQTCEMAQVDDLSLQFVELAPAPTSSGYDGLRCYIDDLCKENDAFACMGWFCSQDDEE